LLGPSLGGLRLSLTTLAVSDISVTLLRVSGCLGAFAAVGRVELIVARGGGLGVPDALWLASDSLGGSFGAVRTFHSGFALGACLPLEAERLIKSWSKNISKEILGIGTVIGISPWNAKYREGVENAWLINGCKI
jgi:hypothetical protein